MRKQSLKTSALLLMATIAVLGAQAFAQMNGAFATKMAENSAKLKQYTYLQKTEIYMRGELKKTQTAQVRYDATTGQKIVIPMGTTEAQSDSGRSGGRFRQRIVESKKEEMKDYIESLTSLMKQYLPPNPTQIKAALPNAQMSGSPAGGMMQISLRNYVKPGDVMTLSIVPMTKMLSQIHINSTLGTDPVTFGVSFSQLPDGTNYPALTTIQSPEKGIEIRVSTSDYRK